MEQDLEHGGEAAGRPALRRAVLTDEQRDEIREAFDLYVPRSCFFLSILSAGAAPVGVVWWNLRLAGQGGSFFLLGLRSSAVLLSCATTGSRGHDGGVMSGEECMVILRSTSLGLLINVHVEACRLCQGVSTTVDGRVRCRRLFL